MPPGIYPVQYYPGRLKASPFTVQFSPPHFVFLPSELVNSVIGLKPVLPQHVPFSYKYELLCFFLILNCLKIIFAVFWNNKSQISNHGFNTDLHCVIICIDGKHVNGTGNDAIHMGHGNRQFTQIHDRFFQIGIHNCANDCFDSENHRHLCFGCFDFIVHKLL